LVPLLVESGDRDEVASSLGDVEDVVKDDSLEFSLTKTSPESDPTNSNSNDVSPNTSNFLRLTGSEFDEVLSLSREVVGSS
jgi:hypothetical protein